MRAAGENTVDEHLQAHLAGDPRAIDRLIPLVYKQLRDIAARQMRSERGDHTLQPTALVNEALVRLLKSDVDTRGRSQFVSIVARTMRRVLVDHARCNRNRPGRQEVSSLEPAAPDGADPIDVLALDEALAKLARLSERQAEVVELRYFGGFTLAEAAAEMGIGRETAKDHWTLAKAWLNRELRR